MVKVAHPPDFTVSCVLIHDELQVMKKGDGQLGQSVLYRHLEDLIASQGSGILPCSPGNPISPQC